MQLESAQERRGAVSLLLHNHIPFILSFFDSTILLLPVPSLPPPIPFSLHPSFLSALSAFDQNVSLHHCNCASHYITSIGLRLSGHVPPPNPTSAAFPSSSSSHIFFSFFACHFESPLAVLGYLGEELLGT